MERQASYRDHLRDFVRAHPWQAAGRLVWVLVAAAWGGASGAFLAWGPLMAGSVWMVILGLVGAVLHGGLWLRQQLAAMGGRPRLARRWRRGLLLGHVGLVMAVGGVAAFQLRRIGLLPPLGQDRMASFDRLTEAMAGAYPYFERKDVDWGEMVERYRPQAARAEDDEAYVAVLDTMLAELDDAHTGVTPDVISQQGCFLAATREMGGQAVVVQVGGRALDEGLDVGSVVLSVDGVPVAEALESVDRRLTAGSTARQRRARAFQYLLHTPFGGRRKVTFEPRSGKERAATLSCPADPAAAAEARKSGEIWDDLLPVVERRIVSRRLPSGVGYVRIPTFGTDLVAEFDAAVDELLDAPALILDLRGNGGGNSAYGGRMAGRLLSEPFAYGRDEFVARLPTRGWRRWLTFRVRPREPVYSGPVLVIMDTGTMSSAEQFLVALVDSGRVRTVGRATGGASGNPTVFRMPGAYDVRFSTGSFVRNDGTPIEGVGLEPDLAVEWTVEDIRAGRDPDLRAAERLLAEGEGLTGEVPGVQGRCGGVEDGGG